MNKNQIKEFVESNPELVSKKPTSIEGVYVLKYKNKVFYKNLWTPELLECRGTVINENYDIISRPFTKIYNYGENGARIHRDDMVTAVEKINGFMAAATIYNGELFVSTTGSIDSDYVKLAEKWLKPLEKQIKKYLPNRTWIFEICDPSDPHVIEEEHGVYLLAIRENTWNSPNHFVGECVLDCLAEAMDIYRPKHYKMLFSELRELASTVSHEGFVCWNEHGYELKLKSPYYLTTKFLGRVKDVKYQKLLNNPSELRKIIDEEFYDVVDYINNDIEFFFSMGEQDKMRFIRNYFDRK